MTIWSGEIKELEILYESFKVNLPDLGKELDQLIKTQDANVVMLYSRRCLEVIITDLCECELKRPRKTEPLKGIIDKLNSEEKVPSHIITSMLGLNSLSTYGTHPKDFDPEQVKPALNNLTIVIKWYLKYRDSRIDEPHKVDRSESKLSDNKEINTDNRKYKKKQKSIIITIALVVLAGVAITIIYYATQGSDSYANLEKSIAVLPFRNDSSDDSTRYFMDGVMEELLTNLQTIKDLRVISRTSVEQYRNQNKPIPEIAQELDVNYIVEGSGQKSGNSLRLRVQLIRAKKESHIWAKSFNSESLNMAEYFSAQSQFAEAIANELGAAITPVEKELIQRIPTENLDAYEAFLKGMIYWRKITPDDLETAMKYYQLALEKDPNYALAYSGIGSVWLARQQIGLVSSAEALPRAEEAFMKSFALDSTAADLSGYYTWSLWDWEKGEKEFKRLIELNPNNALSKAGYSHLLAILGRNEEALTQIENAVDLDPLNEFIKVFYGCVLTLVRKYDEAIEAFHDALKIEPNYPFAQSNLGVTLALSGRYIDAVEQWKLCTAGDSELVNALEKGYNEGGFKGALLSYNKVAELRYKNSYWSPTDIANNYAMVGDNDKALYWLEVGYQIHEPNMPYLLLPVYDNLRDDPRFQNLCKRMKLPYK